MFLGWLGESCTVCVAHLSVLQIHASSFEDSWHGKMVLLFCVMWHKEAFHGSGVLDVSEFNIDWYSMFCLLREKKKVARRLLS
jgi:hypothetical protein